MARSIIRKPPAMDMAYVVSKVPPHPQLARQSFVKLSAATATLSGLAMTGRMVGRAGDIDMVRNEKRLKNPMKIYSLPSASQYETSGSVTPSSRQVQLQSEIVEPISNCPTAGYAGLLSWPNLAPRRYAAGVLLLGIIYMVALGFAVSSLAGQILPGQADSSVPRLTLMMD